MAHTGNENHAVTPDAARTSIRKFSHGAPAGETTSGFFGRKAIEDILAQDGVVGIRFYFARGSRGQVTLVLAGEKGDGVVLDSATSVLANDPPTCPPICDFVDTLS